MDLSLPPSRKSKQSLMGAEGDEKMKTVMGADGGEGLRMN